MKRGKRKSSSKDVENKDDEKRRRDMERKNKQLRQGKGYNKSKNSDDQ